MNVGFSLIIPTYQEALNLGNLLQRIASIDFAQLFEVILVDDNSQDGTEKVVKQLQLQYPWLKWIVRHGPRDLSQAILLGLQQAIYPIIVIMDADLSHPPEKIPLMLAALREADVDMVVGSRYVAGGSIDINMPLKRRLISRGCALLTRLVVPVRDPLSGFIAIKKERCLRGAALQPLGWKIGLEMMVKCQCKNIREIPIHFTDRKLGKSKFNFKEAINYLRHLSRLIIYKNLHE